MSLCKISFGDYQSHKNYKVNNLFVEPLIVGGKTVVVRKIIRNGQPESPEKKEFKPDIKIKTEPADSKGKVKLKPSIKPKVKIKFNVFVNPRLYLQFIR